MLVFDKLILNFNQTVNQTVNQNLCYKTQLTEHLMSIKRKLKRRIFHHIDQSHRLNAKFIKETLKFDTLKVEYLVCTTVLYSFEYVVPRV